MRAFLVAQAKFWLGLLDFCHLTLCLKVFSARKKFDSDSHEAQEWGSMLNKAITLSLLSGSVLFCTVGVLLRKLEGGLRGISHVIVVSLYRSQLIAYFYYEFIPSCREEDGPVPGFSVTLLWGPISKHSRDITVVVTSWLKISRLY